MSSTQEIPFFDKRNLNQIFSLIEEKKWDEAKTKWVLDFLKLQPTEKAFNSYGDPFQHFGKILSFQQKYNELLTCDECQSNLGNYESDYYTFSRDSSNEIFHDFFLLLECRLCRRVVKSKHKGNFNIEPAFLYCETFYKDNTANLKCNQLPRYIEINDLNYKLLLAQIKIGEHFKGIFLLNEKFYLIDDLQHKNRRLRVPKEHKIVSCLYYLC
jgi:hypothetical protein